VRNAEIATPVLKLRRWSGQEADAVPHGMMQPAEVYTFVSF